MGTTLSSHLVAQRCPCWKVMALPPVPQTLGPRVSWINTNWSRTNQKKLPVLHFVATSWANLRRLDDGFQYDHSIPQVPTKMSVCGLCGLFHLSVGNLKSTPFHQEFFHSWRPQAIETWPRSSSRSCYVYCTSKNVCSSAMVMTHDHPMVPYGSIWSRGSMTYPSFWATRVVWGSPTASRRGA